MDIANTTDQKPLIVLTEDEYMALCNDEPYRLIADEAREANGDAPALPLDVMRDILAGRIHPLTAWRNVLGLSQAELATRANVRPATVSEIESGKIDPRVSTVRALATAMALDLDDIV